MTFSQTRNTNWLFLLGVFAFALTVGAGAIWFGLLVINLRATPAVPWSVAIMATLLWLVWKFLNGAPVRRRLLRATLVPRAVFAWAVTAGLLAIVALGGLWIVLAQLVHAKGNAVPDFSHYPIVVVILVIAMASFVTAAAEEAGFRGFFQSALEGRLGFPPSIVLSSFVILHTHALTQGFALTTMVFYLCVDIMLGVLAYLTQSILPGLLVHAVGLVFFFTLVWPFDAGRRFVGTDGADLPFWLHVAQVFVAAALSVLAFGRLARASAPLRAPVV
jgi:membrane protease YdiL (CAAX protease family)